MESWNDRVDLLAWEACLDLSGAPDRAASQEAGETPEAFVDRWARVTDREEWARTGSPYFVRSDDGSPAYPENSPIYKG